MSIHVRSMLMGVVLTVMIVGGAQSSFAVTTAFTYQGQLQLNGTPTTSTCDFQFAPFDAASGGTQVATMQALSPVTVTDGLFTVQLDFGTTPFTGADRYLEIGVRCPIGTGTFATLSPRQRITATPYAVFSATVADGAITSAQIADGSITAADVGFNFAASSSKNGAALDVGFPYAGSNSKAGPANDVACAGCVGTTVLQDSGVTAAKITPAGSVNGQVLTSNGSTVVWQDPAPLALPFAATISNSSDALSITNNGTGRGLLATSKGTDFSQGAVEGQNTSGGNGVVGRAGKFGVDGGSGVYGEHGGLGAGVTGVGFGFGVGVRAINNLAGGVAADLQGRLQVRVTSGDTAVFQSSGSNVARIDKDGKGFFNGGTQSSGADVAEFIRGSVPLMPGDVVEIDPAHPGNFRLAGTPNSTAVAGVISTAPGVTLNGTEAKSANDEPHLALVGRVPVKVTAENGPIQPGDLLVASSTPGHAMRSATNPAPGTVIGKALSSHNRGTGITEMLVMLR